MNIKRDQFKRNQFKRNQFERNQFFQDIDPLCRDLVRGLKGIEKFQRRFFPPEIAPLQEELLPLATSLEKKKATF